MNCKTAADLILTDHIDGNIEARASGELNEHLKSCPDCRLLAEEAKRAGAIFQGQARKDPPPEVWRNIRAEIEEARENGYLATFFEKMRFVLSNLKPAAVAIGAVVILLVFAATVRFTSMGNYAEIIQAREDVIDMISLNGDTAASESVPGYDLGTPAEIYFL